MYVRRFKNILGCSTAIPILTCLLENLKIINIYNIEVMMCGIIVNRIDILFEGANCFVVILKFSMLHWSFKSLKFRLKFYLKI